MSCQNMRNPTNIPIAQKDRVLSHFKSLAPDIPNKAHNLLITLGASNTLEHVITSGFLVKERFTVNKRALITPVPDIPRFTAKEPCGSQDSFPWALIHGTTIKGAQSILSESLFRPADWTWKYDYSPCDMPTFGTFGMGMQVGRDNVQFPKCGGGTHVTSPLSIRPGGGSSKSSFVSKKGIKLAK